MQSNRAVKINSEILWKLSSILYSSIFSTCSSRNTHLTYKAQNFVGILWIKAKPTKQKQENYEIQNSEKTCFS